MMTMNSDYQKKIEDKIKVDIVDENFINAMDNNPELFIETTMLYIDCLVNNVPLKPLIDTGAQSTIMSISSVERCNLLFLIDKNYTGEVYGVGKSKIIGKINLAQIQIEDSYFPISILVIDNNDLDFIIGLDMMKRHLMEINLKENYLKIENVISKFIKN